MSIFDDIRRDREAGTPGPWGHREHWADDDEREVYGRADETPPFGEWSAIATVSAYDDTEYGDKAEANARRIARVPELERIALDAEELAAAVDHERNMVCQDFDMQLQANNRVDAALAKLREATA